jgi:hypothetical protein
MTRKILTLFVNDIPTRYYIDFDKDRKQFNLQPEISGTSAPSFRIIERYGVLIEVEETDPGLIEQAKQKIKEILSDPNFD